MSNCCEKCRVDGEFENQLCHNHDCPCHAAEQPHTHVRCTDKDCLIDEKHCSVCCENEACECHEPHTEKVGGELPGTLNVAMVGMLGSAELPLISVKDGGDVVEVKTEDLCKYERECRAADRAELIKAVKGLRRSEDARRPHDLIEVKAYNQALDDVLNHLGK